MRSFWWFIYCSRCNIKRDIACSNLKNETQNGPGLWNFPVIIIYWNLYWKRLTITICRPTQLCVSIFQLWNLVWLINLVHNHDYHWTIPFSDWFLGIWGFPGAKATSTEKTGIWTALDVMRKIAMVSNAINKGGTKVFRSQKFCFAALLCLFVLFTIGGKTYLKQ